MDQLPLTAEQLVDAGHIVIKSIQTYFAGTMQLIEEEELYAMALEAVIVADQAFKQQGTRLDWVIRKGMYLVFDAVRQEITHYFGLTEWEMRDKTDWRRRIDRDPLEILLNKSSQIDVELTVGSNILLDRQDAVLARLSDQRISVAFRLTTWHDWTQAEVALLLGIDYTRVSQLIKVARKKLSEEFIDLSPDSSN